MSLTTTPGYSAPTTGVPFGIIHARDEKAAGTDGGTFTLGAWRTRTLNTLVTDETGLASLGSNQLTIPAGTYYCIARLPAVACGANKAQLYNISDTAATIIGASAYASVGGGAGDHAWVIGQFTITAAKTFELQHQSLATQATNGFGVATNIAVTEVYSEIFLLKIR